MDGHEHEGLSDQALDQEIEAVLAVDPSPEFLARVRTRVASEPVQTGWSWPRSLVWAGGPLVVVAVAIVALWMGRTPGPAAPEGVRTAMAPPVEPSVSTLDAIPEIPSTNVEGGRADAPGRSPAAGDLRSKPRAPASEPEVLISEEEAVALQRLFAAVSWGRLELAALPGLDAGAGPLAPIEEIVLEPITLSPLAGLGAE